MNSVEFHKLNNSFYKSLSSHGFKKGKNKSSWLRPINKLLAIEIGVRMDRSGWDPYFGSSFIYDVTPVHQGKRIYSKAGQLRLFELKEFDPQLVDAAQAILNDFSNKLPEYEGCESDDYYIHLKSMWSRNKVLEYDSRWYYFYDEENILAWHTATYGALLKALDATQAKFEAEDFDKHNRSFHSKQFEVMHIEVDIDTGEVKETK